MVIFLALLSCFNIFAASKTQSYLPGGYTLFEKQKQFSLITNYFKSTGRYNYDKTFEAHTDNEAFSRIEAEASGAYGFSNRLMVSYGLMYRMNAATFTPSGGSEQSLSSTGVDSYFGSFRYGMPKVGRLHYALEAGVRISAYTNDAYQTSSPYQFLVLGDAGTVIYAGVNMSYETFNGHQMELFTKFRSHSELADDIYYDARGVLHFLRFAFLIGLRGAYAVGADEYSDSPSTKPKIGEQNTNLYNSIEASYMEPYAQMNFGIFDSWRLELGGGIRTQGKSTDQGMFAMAGLVYTSGGVTEKDKKVAQFKEYFFEATIIKVSEQGGFLKIDKGVADHFEKGMRVDIYEDNLVGGNKLIATGQIYDAKSNFSVVRILKFYSNQKIETGHMVRAAD